MNELTDEQVMQPPADAPQQPQREQSDEEVMQAPADLYTEAAKTSAEVTPRGYFGRIVDRFKSGAAEGYGDEQFGFSDQNKKWLNDTTSETFKAFADNFLIPAVAQLDKTWRTPNSIYHAFGDALIEAGVPRDLVALPEAFLGSPKPTGMFERPGLAKPIVEPEAPPKPNPIVQAADLGVIGEPKPKLSEGTVEQAADAATKPKVMAAAQKDEKITGEPPGEQNPWQQRFDHFVDKLETPDDVKSLIRDAAKENNDFLPARQGDIPLSHVEGLAEAAGVAADTVDPRGVGRMMKNDNEVRIGMRTMLQLTETVKDAARAVKEDGSPENLMKLQESMMRRDMAVEQVVGMRAEWGRTGGVFQEFMRDVKDQESLNAFLKDKGRTPGDLKEIADAIDTLDRTQAARVLSDMHSKTPTPFYWTWVNGLISGWLTHTKYVAANALYTVSENGTTPALAAMIGKAKQIVGVEADRVYFGEPMAATWGLLNSVPSAVIAASKSVYSGQRAVLKSELELHKAAMERGEKVSPIIERAVNQVTGQNKPTGKLAGVIPLDGIWGRIIGAPGDAAMGIHTLFKVMGERAGIEAEAYRGAIKEGLDPSESRFWNRRSEIAENPTEDMRARAVAQAYKGTFMGELGPRGKAWQRFTKETPGLKWVFPFSHIPVNLLKSTYEHMPLAVLDSEMRADITGKNGGVAQDKAIARMVVGSSIMGYFVNSAMNGRATGDYPLDPKERDSWKLSGKQPNSILIGNTWVSYNKFGPAGDVANLGANIAQVLETLTSGDDDAMTKGTFRAANAASRLVVDEVGFQSLANLFDAMHDEKKGTAWVANTAGSFVPFSSLLGQTASYRDPYMRETKTFFDGLKFRLPGEGSMFGIPGRETLLPKRDFLGEPIPNAQYGNILRQRIVNQDPVAREMERLQIHPGPPADRVGGVKLQPEMYDRYQVVAGALTKQTLESIVSSPGWKDQPDFVREMALRSAITTTRQMAAGAMQAANPALIQEGVKQKMDHILGYTHTDKPKHAPVLASP